MKRSVAFFVLILFLSTHLFAQNSTINSSWEKLHNGNSSSRVNAAKILREHYDSESFDTLRLIGESLFFYGIDNHYPPAIEYGKIIIAEFYVNSGRENEGIGIAKGITAALQEREDFENLSEAFRVISVGYKRLGDGNSAYLWAKKAIETNKNNPDKEKRVQGYPLLAEAYLLQGKTQKALDTYADYIQKVIQIKEHRRLSSAYSRVGDIHRIQGKIEEAAKYFQLSLQAAEKTKLTTPMGHAINNLAITYFEQGDTTKAKEYFFKSYNLRKTTNNTVNICESLFNIGEFYYYTNQLEQALVWYGKSRDLAQKEKVMQAEIDALKCISVVNKDLKDFEAATLNLEAMLILQSKVKAENKSEHEDLTQLQFEVWKSDFDFNNYENRDKQRILTITILSSACVLLLAIVVWLFLRIRKAKQSIQS